MDTIELEHIDEKHLEAWQSRVAPLCVNIVR
jgi:hypothetical protein